jgi:hypothetical protein
MYVHSHGRPRPVRDANAIDDVVRLGTADTIITVGELGVRNIGIFFIILIP